MPEREPRYSIRLMDANTGLHILRRNNGYVVVKKLSLTVIDR